MRRTLIPLVGLTAAALLPIGAASAAVAYPVKDKTLTGNSLYAKGALPTTKCPEKPIKKLDAGSAKSYLNGVLTCLNRTWAVQVRKAGKSFSKAKAVFVTKAPKRFCGAKWLKDWTSYYCGESRTITIVLTKRFLKEPDDLFLFNLLAVNYAEHVQKLTSIDNAYQNISYRNKAELAEQNRRYNLQSECFSAAFIASVWDSLDRTKKDWDDLLYYIRDWASKDQGSRKSITYWADRGFKSADPGSCNTWSAASSKVA
ncbi:hypothetical protein ACGFIV_12190 [Sphaerisporangium sp. NPDC049003]|uniref:hypothetical protein n=1 Tax=Sphaerisporangium sp. NPDC049003 TaxID=3364517 RepID=UPI0037218C67